jgi:hypothetical protein
VAPLGLQHPAVLVPPYHLSDQVGRLLRSCQAYQEHLEDLFVQPLPVRLWPRVHRLLRLYQEPHLCLLLLVVRLHPASRSVPSAQ